MHHDTIYRPVCESHQHTIMDTNNTLMQVTFFNEAAIEHDEKLKKDKIYFGMQEHCITELLRVVIG